MRAVEHNANWAMLHGCSFTLFHSHMVEDADLESRWEKVAATRRMLHHESSCRWLLFLDADAIVVDVARGPEELLRRMEAEASSSTVMYAACNSPIGRGLNCDTVCCGRAVRRTGCDVGLRDGGRAIPYPCLINSGVYFIKSGSAGLALLREWEGHQRTMRDNFGEQESLNIVKESHPELIEVVGGQVMNTHSSFHSRMRAFRRPEVAYDIALRLSTGYEPSIPTPGFPQGQNVPLDRRLNVTLYQEAALEVYGHALGSRALLNSLDAAIGECVRDRSAFLCHPFARPEVWKQKLAAKVATAKRSQLERLLSETRNGSYVPVEQATSLHMNTSHQSKLHHSQQMHKPPRQQHQQHLPPPPPPPPPLPPALSSHPDRGTVLVCLAGQLRTFLQPDVQGAFATNVHHLGYEYVISTDRARPEQPQLLLLAPVVEWVQHNGTAGEEDSDDVRRSQSSALPACSRRTCHPYRRPAFIAMAEKIESCHAPMEREEARRSFSYAFVLRLRPDHLFLKPLPHPATLLRTTPRGRILLWDDQIAVALRWLASTVLLTPRVVFGACPSAAQWVMACSHLALSAPADARALNASLRSSHCREQPCETMNLITAFSPARKSSNGADTNERDSARGAITHERLRVAHRSWQEGQRQPVNSGDFCIKRHKWLLDDAANYCRENGGCMDC